jgi:hypothetical protein
LQDGRIVKAKARAEAVHRLTKINKAASKLTPTGVAPMQDYGLVAQGASPSQVTKLRKNIRRGTHLGDSRGCVTSIIAWIFDSKVDPWVSTGVNQIASWIDLWTSRDRATQEETRGVWSKMLGKLATHPSKWSIVKGPISATIATLLDLQWGAVHPDAWLSKDKKWARIDAAHFSKAQVLGKIQEDLIASAWNKASAHEHGKGLEGGPHLHIAKRAKKTLIKEGSFAAAAALDHVISGSYFDPQPDAEGHYKHEQRCSMCNFSAPATCLHMYWQCTGLREIKHDIMGKTRRYEARAVAEFYEYPCLFARGLLPKNCFNVPDLPDYLEVKQGSRISSESGVRGGMLRSFR